MYKSRWDQAAFQQVAEAKPQLGQPHPERFAIHISQGIFPVGTEPLGDVVLMPGEDSDRLANGKKLQRQLHLTAKPDMVSDHAVLGRVMASFPDLPAEKKRTGLDRHVPIGVDGTGNSDLVEKVKEFQVFVEHDGGTENGIGPGLFQFLQGVG
jgi:hypothetical protein